MGWAEYMWPDIENYWRESGPSISPSNSKLQKSFRLILRKPIPSFYKTGSDEHALYKVIVFLWSCGVESISSTNPICWVSITNILCRSVLAAGCLSFLPDHWDRTEIRFLSEWKLYQEKRKRVYVLSPLSWNHCISLRVITFWHYNGMHRALRCICFNWCALSIPTQIGFILLWNSHQIEFDFSYEMTFGTWIRSAVLKDRVENTSISAIQIQPGWETSEVCKLSTLFLQRVQEV